MLPFKTQQYPTLGTLLCCCLLWGVSAAPPRPGYFSAYVTVDENTLYIQGGSNISAADNVYTQFYSLDLTQSWNTSSPPWIEATTVGPFPPRLRASFHSISYSQRRKALNFWDMNKLPAYSVGFHLDTNKWEDMPTPPTLQPADVKVCKAATDPTTDRIYIPGGASKGMLVYDPSSKKSTTVAMPPGRELSDWSMYTFAWNNMRKSFFLFGGMLFPGQPSLYEYMPASATWAPLISTGSVPPILTGSCMVSAHNGTKMLVFGGSFGLTVSGTLYILDVPTMTWTQGPGSSPRMGMVCSVSGDYFIVWGGMSWDNGATPVPLSETPILYNINLTRWTSDFVPRGKETPTTPIITNSTAAPTVTTTPTGSTEPGIANPVTGEESTSSSNHKAVIIGGSVGGGVFLILLTICGVCLYRRRRRAQQQKLHKLMLEEPTKKLQFRIVQQPATDATIEPTFYPTRPFRITPPTTPKKSKQNIGDRLEKDRLNSPTHWNSSHSQSGRSLTSPSTSTLATSNTETNSTTKILPQHIVTLDRSQAQRNR
ncbi:hypothetical protein BKA57DRAFT_450277 [Linnemannia elongata]|nr:hypothetical protein BKA57DRAFT_450277 [Linnemannia elongata]